MNNDNEFDKKDEKKEEQKSKKVSQKDMDEFEKWIKRNKNNNGNSGWFRNLVLIFLVVSTIFSYFAYTSEKVEKITYTEFSEKLKSGYIDEIYEKDGYVVGKTNNNDKKYKAKLITDRLGDDKELIKLADNTGVNIASSDTSNKNIFIYSLVNMLPIILFIGFLAYSYRSANKGECGPGGLFNIGNVGSKVVERPTTRFTDVAGVEDAKEELVEVVDFLKNPDKYVQMGARIPKGVLLEGEPGTGKTLLARAVAGESVASFITISGSEFVEMYVGVGASRVRKLFKEAKKNKPAIIFIDEIDAIGRKRSNNNGGHDEREQTLNQLLVEMDGFSTSDSIIIIASTNRVDVLDSALTRSGRFDRKIHVNLPDVDGRLAILKVHARNKKLKNEKDLEEIAKISIGFSGADLENLINEAAILAVRRRSELISFEDLSEAFDKIGMGLGRKHAKIDPYTNKLVAFHEAGHALLATILPNANKVHKVTIVPRGDAGGYMMPIPDEKKLLSKNKILDEIKVLYGGRIAEEITMGDITMGAYSDIKQATKYANNYVRNFGMNGVIGPVHLAQENLTEYISDQTNREIEVEIRNLLKEMYKEAKEILEKNVDKLNELANILLSKETISGKEVEQIVFGKQQETLFEGLDETHIL